MNWQSVKENASIGGSSEVFNSVVVARAIQGNVSQLNT
jgi:hypothetical protein